MRRGTKIFFVIAIIVAIMIASGLPAIAQEEGAFQDCGENGDVPPCTCLAASQELGNEAGSGDVGLSGNVTGSGDSSNQAAAPVAFGDSGSNHNGQGVLQECSSFDDADLGGASMAFDPSLNSTSNLGIGESSASNGQ